MPYLLGFRPAHIEEAIARFGEHVRRARQRSGQTQASLQERSGVSQSVISRIEHGQAPRLALDRIIAISVALAPELPLGVCPHDHVCAWRADADPRTATQRAYDAWRARVEARDADASDVGDPSDPD